jgi:hypothetical protein
MFPRRRHPIWKLVVSIPAPSRRHCKHQEPTVVEQLLIGARVLGAYLLGHVGQVELDGPPAAGLEVDK